MGIGVPVSTFRQRLASGTQRAKLEEHHPALRTLAAEIVTPRRQLGGTLPGDIPQRPHFVVRGVPPWGQLWRVWASGGRSVSRSRAGRRNRQLPGGFMTGVPGGPARIRRVTCISLIQLMPVTDDSPGAKKTQVRGIAAFNLEPLKLFEKKRWTSV